MPLEDSPAMSARVGQEHQVKTNPNVVHLGGNVYSHVAWGQQMDRWGRDGVSREVDAADRFDMERDEPIDADLWGKDEVGSNTQAVEAAQQTLSPDQELEIAYNYLDDEGLLTRGHQITGRMMWLRQAG